MKNTWSLKREIAIERRSVPLIHVNLILSVGYGGEDIPEAVLPVLGGGVSPYIGLVHRAPVNL